MHSRIDNIPTLQTQLTYLEAFQYNKIRLGLIRLKSPIRIQLTGLRGMDILLERSAWVCVDRTFYDLPVLAWTDFELAARRAINEPVRCRLHHYHVHADLITNTVLSITLKAISERLGFINAITAGGSEIHAFPAARVRG